MFTQNMQRVLSLIKSSVDRDKDAKGVMYSSDKYERGNIRWGRVGVLGNVSVMTLLRGMCRWAEGRYKL